MGIWGVGIYQNDLAEDIKTVYMELLRDGKSPQEAYETVLTEFRDIQDAQDEVAMFWYALSDTMWSSGTLFDEPKEKTLIILKREIETLASIKDNTKQVNARMRVLIALRDRLSSPPPPAKNYRKSRLYTCPWNVGDIYRYPLDSDVARSLGFSDSCLLFHKVGDSTFYPGHIVPVVRIKLVNSDYLPTDAAEFDSIPYLRVGLGNLYRMKLLNTSKRATPQKLTFWGHIGCISAIEGEYIPENDWEYISYLWKWFDGFLLKNLLQFNSEII